jgi:hypothetical protein
VRCMRSCRPFCCGWPGLMRSMAMPRRSHHTDSYADIPSQAADQEFLNLARASMRLLLLECDDLVFDLGRQLLFDQNQ